MKTEALPSPKSSRKLIPKVTRGFVSAHSPVESEIINDNWVAADSEIITETTSKGDARIRKRSQPLVTQKRSTKTESVPTRKSSTKTFGVDSSARPALVDLETVIENWNTLVSEIVNETDCEGDAWICQRQQPLLSLKLSTKTSSLSTLKSSPKNFPKVMRGFGRAHNSCSLRKSQRKRSYVDCEIVNETTSKGDA
jgi:hypothetical protein